MLQDADKASADRPTSVRPQRWERISVACLVFGALLLRVVNLKENPPGLWVDEASIGWNAYCILRTGRNEHGERFPLSFPSIEKFDVINWRSEGFWDYKGPVYVYAAAASIAIFDRLDAFAIRFPAAVAGTGMVLVAYLLARRWFGRVGGLSAAGLVALSPWALHFSRIGFGACISVPIVSAAVYCFLVGLNRRAVLIASGLLFAAGAYGYQIYILFCPILMAGLFVTYFRQLWASRTWACVWLGSAALASLPLGVRLVGESLAKSDGAESEAQRRFDYISVFSPSGRQSFAEREADRTGNPEFAESWVFQRWYTAAAYSFVRHWSPDFLLFHGDSQPRNSVAGYRVRSEDKSWEVFSEIGGLLWVTALFVIAGVVRVVRSWRYAHSKFLFFWLATWAIPASLTVEGVPQAIRSMVSLPMWQIFAAAGVSALAATVRRSSIVRRALALIVLSAGSVIWVIQSVALLLALFFMYPRDTRRAWDHHIPEVIDYAIAQQFNYSKCVVSPAHDTLNTYIAFRTQHDPEAHLTGDRPFIWTEEIAEWEPGVLYLVGSKDERNPALLDAWARGSGLPRDAFGSPSVVRLFLSATAGAALRIFPEDEPKLFYVTAETIRQGAQFARDQLGVQRRQRGTGGGSLFNL